MTESQSQAESASAATAHAGETRATGSSSDAEADEPTQASSSRTTGGIRWATEVRNPNLADSPYVSESGSSDSEEDEEVEHETMVDLLEEDDYVSDLLPASGWGVCVNT